MVEVEENKEMNGLLPSIRAEVAMFILVLLGSVFIALGFVSTSAYHYAMGFPPALFPPQSALLGLMGFVYGIPAICLVAVTPLVGLVGWKAGKNTRFKIIVERVKKNKILQGAMLIIAFTAAMGMVFWNLPAIIGSLLSAILVFHSVRRLPMLSLLSSVWVPGSCYVLSLSLYLIL